jgi:hypothetical protein
VGWQTLNSQWYALGYTEKGAICGIGQSFTKKRRRKKEEEKRKKRRKRKREDTCIVADEQPSTLGEPDFRKVLVTGVHRGNYKAFF